MPVNPLYFLVGSAKRRKGECECIPVAPELAVTTGAGTSGSNLTIRDLAEFTLDPNIQIEYEIHLTSDFSDTSFTSGFIGCDEADLGVAGSPVYVRYRSVYSGSDGSLYYGDWVSDPGNPIVVLPIPDPPMITAASGAVNSGNRKVQLPANTTISITNGTENDPINYPILTTEIEAFVSNSPLVLADSDTWVASGDPETPNFVDGPYTITGSTTIPNQDYYEAEYVPDGNGLTGTWPDDTPRATGNVYVAYRARHTSAGGPTPWSVGILDSGPSIIVPIPVGSDPVATSFPVPVQSNSLDPLDLTGDDNAFRIQLPENRTFVVNYNGFEVTEANDILRFTNTTKGNFENNVTNYDLDTALGPVTIDFRTLDPGVETVETETSLYTISSRLRANNSRGVEQQTPFLSWTTATNIRVPLAPDQPTFPVPSISLQGDGVTIDIPEVSTITQGLGRTVTLSQEYRVSLQSDFSSDILVDWTDSSGGATYAATALNLGSNHYVQYRCFGNNESTDADPALINYNTSPDGVFVVPALPSPVWAGTPSGTGTINAPRQVEIPGEDTFAWTYNDGDFSIVTEEYAYVFLPDGTSANTGPEPRSTLLNDIGTLFFTDTNTTSATDWKVWYSVRVQTPLGFTDWSLWAEDTQVYELPPVPAGTPSITADPGLPFLSLKPANLWVPATSEFTVSAAPATDENDGTVIEMRLYPDGTYTTPTYTTVVGASQTEVTYAAGTWFVQYAAYYSNERGDGPEDTTDLGSMVIPATVAGPDFLTPGVVPPIQRRITGNTIRMPAGDYNSFLNTANGNNVNYEDVVFEMDLDDDIGFTSLVSTTELDLGTYQNLATGGAGTFYSRWKAYYEKGSDTSDVTIDVLSPTPNNLTVPVLDTEFNVAASFATENGTDITLPSADTVSGDASFALPQSIFSTASNVINYEVITAGGTPGVDTVASGNLNQSTTLDVTGLAPGTYEVYYRCEITDSEETLTYNGAWRVDLVGTLDTVVPTLTTLTISQPVEQTIIDCVYEYSDAGGSALDTYYFLAQTSATPPADADALIANGDTQSTTDETVYNITGLTAGVSYYVFSCATNTAGNKSLVYASTPAFLDRTPPALTSASVALNGTNPDTAVDVTYAYTDNVGVDKVYVWVSSTQTMAPTFANLVANGVEAGASVFTVSGLTASTQYHVWIGADDAAGNESAVSEATNSPITTDSGAPVGSDNPGPGEIQTFTSGPPGTWSIGTNAPTFSGDTIFGNPSSGGQNSSWTVPITDPMGAAFAAAADATLCWWYHQRSDTNANGRINYLGPGSGNGPLSRENGSAFSGSGWSSNGDIGFESAGSRTSIPENWLFCVLIKDNTANTTSLYISVKGGTRSTTALDTKSTTNWASAGNFIWGSAGDDPHVFDVAKIVYYTSIATTGELDTLFANPPP